MFLACSSAESPVQITDSSDPTPQAQTDSSDPAVTDSADTALEPSDYIYDDDDKATPGLAMDEVESAITEAALAIFEIDPLLFHDAYDTATQDAYQAAAAGLEEECPYFVDYYLEDYGQYYWSDTCTDDRGTSYAGYGISYNLDGYTSGSTIYPHYRYFYGDALVTDPDGHSIEGSGYLYYYEYSYPGSSRTTYLNTYGTYRSDDPEHADTWLAQDLDIEINLTASHYQTYPGSTMSLTASVGGLEGAVSTVRMEEVYLYSESLGSMCPGEPSGLVSVRDDEGNWYEVDFHGPEYWGAAVFMPDCDGCGQVSWRGEALGTVCPDFSRLVSWESRPW
jgi:hypothetical protein